MRSGLIAYDQRKGWRGPIININYDENWFKKIDKKYSLEKSINWKIAIVKKVKKFEATIETFDKLNGLVTVSYTHLTLPTIFRV